MMQPFTQPEILLALGKVTSVQAPGWDGVPPVYYKMARYSGSPPVTNLLLPWIQRLFDLSLSSGMPVAWAHTLWHPIPKQAHEDPMKAYRMISLTSGLYRVLMRCMATRVQTWLTSQDKVPVHQFAFLRAEIV